MTTGILWAFIIFTMINIIITALMVRGQSPERDQEQETINNNVRDLTKKLGLEYLSSIRSFISRNHNFDKMFTTKEQVDEMIKAHACREFNLLLKHLGLEVRESLTKTELVKVGKAKK